MLHSAISNKLAKSKNYQTAVNVNNLRVAQERDRYIERGTNMERKRESYYAILCPPVHSREQKAFSWTRINPRFVLWPSKELFNDTVRNTQIVASDFKHSRWWALEHVHEPFLFAKCSSRHIRIPLLLSIKYYCSCTVWERYWIFNGEYLWCIKVKSNSCLDNCLNILRIIRIQGCLVTREYLITVKKLLI